MLDKLKSRTLHGLFWGFMEVFGQQGLQMVIMIILARILLPAEFGLIAMLTVFIMVSESFIDSGFGTALIQKKDATYVDECSVFYFNIFIGISTAGILYISAPLIAAFYEIPELTKIARVLSIILIIS